MELQLPPRVTERAFARILEIGSPHCIRIAVEGGGCSGFQYEIKQEENILDEDTVIDKGGASVVIDALSLEFLYGATIDFTDEIIGARFIINNPNASSSCGCGISFSM
ncbi:MAG: iron-sulfur cluster assembly accessory protein [Pseudomonadota bacterium]|nr:iron-sulfur cluster assembly accessory protein [Pseudomonadota bacterium]